MPNLAQHFVVPSGSADLSVLSTPTFKVGVGDVVVVKGVLDTTLLGAQFSTPIMSNGGTMVQYAVDNTALKAWVGIWGSTIGADGVLSISATPSATAGTWHALCVERWTNAKLATTPATNSTKTGVGAPSATVTTTKDNSVVTYLNADTLGLTSLGRILLGTSGTPNEEGMLDNSSVGFMTAYFAWQWATVAGTQTIGMSAPSGQSWSMLGIEILHQFRDWADPNSFQHERWA